MEYIDVNAISMQRVKIKKQGVLLQANNMTGGVVIEGAVTRNIAN